MINGVEMTIEMKNFKYMTVAEINIIEWAVALELVEVHGMLVLAIHELEINHRATLMKRKNVIEMATYELMSI